LIKKQFEASGLQPFTTYYYQFNVCDSDKASPLGRTKTIPGKTQKVDRNINFAVYSCSNYRKPLTSSSTSLPSPTIN
jgi:alkaline phosphatase D